MKARNLLPWMLILFGAMLIAAPMLFPLSVAVPPSYPWIPEGCYSYGEIDYVSRRTGKYYLAVCPVSEKGVALSTVKVIFTDLDVEFPMSFKHVIEYDAYDWYSYWFETDVGGTLQFNINYTIQFYVEDAKGRSCIRTSWVIFIPVELLPVPEGYFTINGQEAVSDTVIFVTSPEITIAFVPTKYAEYIKHVDVEVYKDDKLIGIITSQELPETAVLGKFQKQPDGTWQANYTLPEAGVYRLDGYVVTEQRTLQLMSITLNNGAPPPSNRGIILQIAGAALTIAGAIMLIKKK